MSPQLTYKLTNDTSVKVQTTNYLKSFPLTYKLYFLTSFYHWGATAEKKNQFFGNCGFFVKDTEKFIKHHLFIYKRFTTDQNFKGVTQKLRLPRP